MTIDFVNNVQQHVDAAYPILYVRTFEEERAARALRQVQGVKAVWTWTVGRKKWEASTGQSAVAADAGKAVEAIASLPDDSLYVLRDFHALWLPVVVRSLRDLLPVLREKRRTVVIVSPVVNIPVELSKEVASVDFDLPDRAALDRRLEAFVADAAKAAGGAAPAVPSRARVLDVLRGLTDDEADNALALALARHGDLGDDAVVTIRNEKAAAIRRSGLVDWVEPSVTLADVGGLRAVKRYVDRIAPAFHDPDAARAFGLLDEDFPRAVALVGMPGCGKSLAAEAIPTMLKVGLVRTDFGSLFGAGGGKVGQAEAAAQDRNRLVEAQAPIVDWWDEAEKGLAGAAGHSTANPWEARVAGSMLTWLETYRVPVLVVPTINKQELLPPEMLSRFQKVFFVDFPNPAARRDIWRIHLGKRRQGELAERRADDLVELSDGYNGREIRNAVQAAMQAAFARQTAPAFDDVAATLKAITPLSKSRASDLAGIRKWAEDNDVENADDADAPADGPARRVAVRKR